MEILSLHNFVQHLRISSILVKFELDFDIIYINLMKLPIFCDKA